MLGAAFIVTSCVYAVAVAARRCSQTRRVHEPRALQLRAPIVESRARVVRYNCGCPIDIARSYLQMVGERDRLGGHARASLTSMGDGPIAIPTAGPGVRSAR